MLEGSCYKSRLPKLHNCQLPVSISLCKNTALQLNLIWLLILPSGYYTFPLQISWDHFVLDYNNN